MTFKTLLAASLFATATGFAVAAETPPETPPATSTPAAPAATGDASAAKTAKPVKRHDHAAERSGPSAKKAPATEEKPEEMKMKRHDHMRDMK